MYTKICAFIFSLLVISLPLYAIPSPAMASQHPVNLTPKINLNTANRDTLAGSFKGIGKKRAEAIITYRDEHNGFKSIEELADIKGLGRNFVDRNRDRLKEIYVVD